jgi:phthalate 4,5-cis-dihydrodiol dehydrogenase
LVVTPAIGVGIAGWGAPGRFMAGALARSQRFTLAGVADKDPDRLDDARTSGAPAVVSDMKALVELPTVQIVYVALPTASHLAAVKTAVQAGKTVIVEKPLARSVEEGSETVSVARAAGVPLVVGATRGMDAPVVLTRRVVEDGRLGKLLAVTNLCSTDWHRRPRRPDDLDARAGGGLVFRQGGHQFDILRLIAGGLGKQVHASTYGGANGQERGYSAFVTFSDGVVGTAVYHGAGGLDSRSLTGGVGELGERIAIAALEGTREVRPAPAGTFAPQFGYTIATFEHGDVVPALEGIRILRADGTSMLVAAEGRSSGWDALLCEVAKVVDGTATTYDGDWGLATLEACSAVHESTRTGQPVDLHHQVASSPQARIGVRVDHR